MREAAWLIERFRSPGEKAMWLSVQGRYGLDPSGSFVWTADAFWALRFSRQQDAQLFIGALLNLGQELPHRLTIPQLRRGDALPSATEHVFLDEPAEPDE